MSWLDRVTNREIEIITGEGSVFSPIWKNARKVRNHNASRFDFNNIEGSLIKRGDVSGLIIPFEFHFIGENNIEETERFDIASKDKRPWTLKHPLYDEILCHPVSINYDDSSFNVTRVTGELWETLQDTFPDSTIDIQESVLEAVELLTENVSVTYSNNLGTPEATNISTTTSSINTIADNYRAAAVTDIDKQNVENAVSSTLSALNSLSSDARTFMIRAAALARTPARFYASVETRINIIEESYQDLKLAVTGLLSRQNKLFFESLGGSLISAKAEASVLLTAEIADDQDIEDNQIEDYTTRNDVFNTANNLDNSLNDFFDTLGSFQTENDSTPQSYTPTDITILNSKDALQRASGQLLQISIEAKQERKYTVPQNTNIILLVHRLFGNTENDTIDSFIKANELKQSEMLQIEKNKEVIYFV